MASIVLPQALYMMPTNVAKLQSKKLGVSSFLPQFNAASASISMVPSSRCRFSSGFRSRDSFVVRADAEADAEPDPESTTVAAETTDDVEDGSVTEAEEVVEKTPPKKPIVKLSDIMGILNKQAVEASETLRPVPDLRTGDIIVNKLASFP